MSNFMMSEMGHHTPRAKSSLEAPSSLLTPLRKVPACRTHSPAPNEDTCSTVAPSPAVGFPSPSPSTPWWSPAPERSRVANDLFEAGNSLRFFDNLNLGLGEGLLPYRMTLDSLPRTPRARTGPVTPPRSPRKTALPQMMEALYMDSLATVEAVLREEPDSAWEPFWDYDQETPLCFAARQLCNVKILDLLLQRGAKVDVGNRDGRTALDLAKAAKTFAQEWTAWDDLPFNFPSTDFPPLPTRSPSDCPKRQAEVVQFLEAASASVKPTLPLGGSAPALDFGAFLNGNDFGLSPFLSFASTPWERTLRQEPVQMASSEEPREEPMTPTARQAPTTPGGAPRKSAMPAMMAALSADSLEEVDAAIKADADSAWEPFWDHDVEPPLCFAARNLCDPRIVQLLLSSGASTTDVDQHGQTPLELAESSKTGTGIEISWGSTTSCESSSFFALPLPARCDSAGRQAQIVQLLLDSATPQSSLIESECSESLMTPPMTPTARQAPTTPGGAPRKPAMPAMMAALSADSLEEVDAAIKADADSAWEPFWDHDVEPPLCFAARNLCDPRIVQLLLSSGASATASDKDAKTPLELIPVVSEAKDEWRDHRPFPSPFFPEPMDHRSRSSQLSCLLGAV